MSEPSPPTRSSVNARTAVSARVDARLRAEVVDGTQPRPESLRLEELYGVELLDWTVLRSSGGHRSVLRSLSHVAHSLSRLRRVDVVFSDGEHLGIPMALAMRTLRIKTPHLVIGHHLDTRAKRLVFRWMRPDLRMDRVLVHSANQLVPAHRDLGRARTAAPRRYLMVSTPTSGPPNRFQSGRHWWCRQDGSIVTTSVSFSRASGDGALVHR